MGKKDYITLLVLFAILFLAVADNQILSPLLPLLSKDLGVLVHWVGQLVTGYALAAGIVSWALSGWSDRLGRPLLIRWALLLFSISSLICTLAGSFAALLVGRLATGIAAGILSFNIIAFVGDTVDFAHRGRAMGIVYSAYFAALVGGVPLGSWIAEGLGWRAVFLGGAVLALGLYLVSTYYLQTPLLIQTTGAAAIVSSPWYAAAQGFLRERMQRRGMTTAFCVSGGIVCMLTYLGAWLHQDYGMKTHQIGSLFMISGLAALASSLLGGYLSDRVGKRRAFLVGNSTTAAAMLVLPWNLGVPLLLTVFFILGFGAAVRQSPMEAIVTELVVSEKRGRYIAFRNLFSQLGIAISVLVGGVLFHTFGYTAVVLLATALTAAGSLLMPKIAE